MFQSSLNHGSLEHFLILHQMEFLYQTLKNLGILEPNDMRYVTTDLIDSIVSMTNMTIIQRRKFENLIETQKHILECNEEMAKTTRMKDLYNTKYTTMKCLLDNNQITESEFEEWRREEFAKCFQLVSYFIFINLYIHLFDCDIDRSKIIGVYHLMIHVMKRLNMQMRIIILHGNLSLQSNFVDTIVYMDYSVRPITSFITSQIFRVRRIFTMKISCLIQIIIILSMNTYLCLRLVMKSQIILSVMMITMII
jgi:hypothetical protein